MSENPDFVDLLIGNCGHLVHRIRAKDTTGKFALYFIYVRENRERAFLSALRSDDVDLEDYGDVLASCYGDQPTPEVRDVLQSRYGFSV